ncbi:MAG: glycosyltransferase family 39 protein [bacterium]|nr:glycosyltransferase family 39 protein [bacterium]
MEVKREKRREIGGLILILVIALAVRILYLYQFSQLPDWTHLTVDNNYHLNWARNMAEGNWLGDTTYFRAPLYIFVLALIIKLAGVSLWVFRIFGLMIGLATTILVYQTSRFYSGIRAARLASLLYAFFPIVIYFESELLLDSFFTFLLLAAWYLTLRAARSRTRLSLFIAGLVWGLSAITRPTSLLLLPLSLWPVIRKNGSSLRVALKNSLTLLAGAVIIVGLVATRNLVIASDPVLIASQAGINLYIGNNPNADGVSAGLEEPLGLNWRISDIAYEAENQVGRDLKPGEVSNFWRSRALAWITENPVEAGQLYLAKLSYFFSNLEFSNNRSLGRFLDLFPFFKYNPLGFGLLLLIAAIGFVASRKLRPELMPVAVMIILYAAGIALFFVTSRFRLPVIPFMLILGSSAIGMTWSQIVKRKWWILTAGVPAALLAFVPLAPTIHGTPSMDYISRGLTRYAHGDYPTALRIFEEGRGIDSTFPEINLNCGAACVRLGKTDSASYYFSQEIKFNPQRNAAYTNLASLHLLNDQPEQALSLARQSVELRPFDINANLILIRAAAVSEQISDDYLLQITDSTIARTDQELEVLLESGIALLKRGDPANSEKVLRAALVSPPPPIETDDFAFDRNFRHSQKNRQLLTASAHYQLSYLLGLNGRYSDAVYQAGRAIELDSSRTEAYVNLISGYLALGERGKADSVLSLAERKFPGNALLQRFR